MTAVTTAELRRILIGTELSGRVEEAYRINFAVPNSLLRKERGNNASGFTFGVVQLDIATNTIASNAYRDMLDGALQRRFITTAEHQLYMRYRGVSRPDLNASLEATRRQVMRDVTDKVLSRTFARAIVDAATEDYLQGDLLGDVNGFLAEMDTRWPRLTGSVFRRSNAEFPLALAAVTSIANRFGNLGTPTTGTTRYFVRNAPSSITVVRARFNAILPPTDWSHVVEGAREFSSGSQQGRLQTPSSGTIRTLWRQHLGPDDDDVRQRLDGLNGPSRFG